MPEEKQYDPAVMAHRVKWMREGRRLSLRELEERTGIGDSYLSQLERGKIKKPGVFTLLKLAEFYHVKIEWLAGQS